MGIKWSEGFDKSAHKSAVKSPQARQALMQKAGAIKYVKRVSPPKIRTPDGKSRWSIQSESRAVSKDFVFPGALVRLTLEGQRYHGGHKYCTVISEHQDWNGNGRTESLAWGKYWQVLMPDGVQATVNSRYMRPLTDVQNGNLPDDEDEEEPVQP